MKISGIYQIRNLLNGKLYIGQSININARFNKHKSCLRRNIHQNKHLQNAWNIYGENNFEFSIIEIVNNIEFLNEKEQYYIDLTNCYNNEFGYNARHIAESPRGYKLSDEIKLKMSIAHKGEKAYWYGKHLSEETKLKISKKNKGRKYTKEQSERLSKVLKGKKRQDETIKKMCQAQKGSKNPNSKLNEDNVKEIKKLLNNNIKIDIITQQFHVSNRTIYCIKQEKTWQHIQI